MSQLALGGRGGGGQIADLKKRCFVFPNDTLVRIKHFQAAIADTVYWRVYSAKTGFTQVALVRVLLNPPTTDPPTHRPTDHLPPTTYPTTHLPTEHQTADALKQ